MTEMKSPLEVYKLLNGSNCQRCMFPSCMAFAAAVFKGKKRIYDCPEVDRNTVKSIHLPTAKQKKQEEVQLEKIEYLKRKVSKVNFASVALKLGARASGDKLAINCLGKDFFIHSSGELSSDCHYNQWVHVPLLDYIANGLGKSVCGDWLPFNELQGAAHWARFFKHRCEEDIKQLADVHTELFFELLHLFGAQPLKGINADYSFVIYPLPKVPIAINYWIEEDDFGSKLNILFDKTAQDNLTIECIYTLTRGLVEMFRALVVKHTIDGQLLMAS